MESFVALTGRFYRQFAFDSQRDALREILALQSQDIINKLESLVQELGQSLQQDTGFRQAWLTRDETALNNLLQSQFHQYFVTAGVLQLSSLRLYDENFKPVLHVLAPAENSSQPDQGCAYLLATAAQRSGAQRLKTLSGTCLLGNNLIDAVLIPLGGLHITGYLEILTEPSYSLRNLEQGLGLPIRISNAVGEEKYVSGKWPVAGAVDDNIIATLPIATEGDAVGLWLSICQPVNALEQRLSGARNTVLIITLAVTVLVIVLILTLLHRYTFLPLQTLTGKLRTISLGPNDTGAPLREHGTDEVRALTRGYNEMVSALQNSYRQLDAANRELVQHRDHLEDLVNERTADLEQARDDALQASRTKSQFLANMSHELRTPLNAIIGYSEMVLEELHDSGTATTLEDMHKILNSGRHLLELINDVLDLSKIEAGKMDVIIESFSVLDLLRDVSATVHPIVARNGNKLLLRCPDNIGQISADTTKLRQVLLNIVGNAAKFTNSGSITLDVMRYDELGREFISFGVTDTGIGISREHLTRLFQAFSQGDASTTRRYGGTGLGLVLSRHFCRMMGGDIAVNSTAGEGSTFTVFIPTKVMPQTGEHTQPEPPPVWRDLGHMPLLAEATDNSETLLPPSRTRLLVIDDDTAIRELLCRQLAKEGFEIFSAHCGSKGLEMARDLQPDAVLLDILMPGADGWVILGHFKKDERLRNIPVILVSMLDERHTGFALGASEYITKPVEKSQLLAVIQRVLQQNPAAPILVVEDDADLRSMVLRILSKEGWPTTAACNGKEALQAIHQTAPSLVLLDLMMPEMDGFEFLAEMRLHAQWQDIPVIVLTAMELNAEDRQRLSTGAQQILRKGANSTPDLLATIRKTIRNYKLAADT